MEIGLAAVEGPASSYASVTEPVCAGAARCSFEPQRQLERRARRATAESAGAHDWPGDNAVRSRS
jgi:hypothetical protein